MAEQDIERIDVPLAKFVAALVQTRCEEKLQHLLACW